MFMHNGQIGGYERCRRALESLLSDELFQVRHGTTDSELFFLLMVQNGLDDDPLAALRATIAEITEVAEECGADEPFKLTVCFSDGQRLFACRHASEGPPPSLYWQVHEHGMLVASEPNGCDKSPWNEVAAGSILTLDRDIHLEALHPERDAPRPCRILRMPGTSVPAAAA
jgi:glutamine amidotransferase